MNAQYTLVYSTKTANKSFILSSGDTLLNSCNLIDAIFAARRAVARLKYNGRHLYYTPSNEYQQFVVRMKKIK